MAKYKNSKLAILRFDYNGEEKSVIKGAVIEIPETNPYIDGLIEQGILTEVVPAVKSDK